MARDPLGETNLQPPSGLLRGKWLAYEIASAATGWLFAIARFIWGFFTGDIAESQPSTAMRAYLLTHYLSGELRARQPEIPGSVAHRIFRRGNATRGWISNAYDEILWTPDPRSGDTETHPFEIVAASMKVTYVGHWRSGCRIECPQGDLWLAFPCSFSQVVARLLIVAIAVGLIALHVV